MENWMALGISLLLIIGVISLAIYTEYRYDEACREIGFKDYKVRELRYCEDTDGNLHFVKMDCLFPPFTKCNVKTISVGNVRTIQYN